MIVGIVAEEYLPGLKAPACTQLQSNPDMPEQSHGGQIIQVCRAGQKYGFSFEISKFENSGN